MKFLGMCVCAIAVGIWVSSMLIAGEAFDVEKKVDILFVLLCGIGAILIGREI